MLRDSIRKTRTSSRVVYLFFHKEKRNASEERPMQSRYLLRFRIP